MTDSVDVAHQQVLELVAEARLCCDAFQLGIDSLLIRETLPTALAELTALKHGRAVRDAMLALQAALQSDMGQRGSLGKSQSAAQESSDQLEAAVAALEFYAAGDNHTSASGKPSAVARDKGRCARQALEAISGEADDEGQE